jgi:hypothetical protein
VIKLNTWTSTAPGIHGYWITILCAILRSGTLSCIAICMDRTNSAQMPNRPSADRDSRSLKFVCINKKKVEAKCYEIK